MRVSDLAKFEMHLRTFEANYTGFILSLKYSTIAAVLRKGFDPGCDVARE